MHAAMTFVVRHRAAFFNRGKRPLPAPFRPPARRLFAAELPKLAEPHAAITPPIGLFLHRQLDSEPTGITLKG